MPESKVLLSDNTLCAIAYFLSAQLDPKSADQFADKDHEVSTCRDERAIHVYRDLGSVYEIETEGFTQTLEAQIGGFFGIGGQHMRATISMDPRDFYNIDEDVNIEFDIDNRRCEYPVKSFKVKLHRELSVFSPEDRDKIIYSKSDYIS